MSRRVEWRHTEVVVATESDVSVERSRMFNLYLSICIGLFILTSLSLRRPDDSNLILTQFCRFSLNTLDFSCTYPNLFFCEIGRSLDEVCLEFVPEGKND